MKKIYTSLLLLFVAVGFTQSQTTQSINTIPAGYYSTATGTGYTLKTQLYNKIHTHTVLSYTPGLWQSYPTTDARPDGKVWDIYSSCNFVFGTVANGGNQDNGTGGNTECQLYNREHTFPKSWFNDTSSPMYTDLFHVMPTDKKDNGARGNLAYGIVGTTISLTTSNGSKIGNNITPNAPAITALATVFEPADEYKGDVARNYFYMATCYENIIAGWKENNPSGSGFLDGTNNKVFQQWSLDMLYAWHIQDPVSAKEIARNDAVYGIQGNRNPFIDHPEYVQVIWGAVLSVKNFDAFASVTVFPNPSNDHRVNIQSEVALDQIELVNINGQIVQQIKKPVAQNNTYTLNNLPQGFYFVKLTADNQTAVKKVIVN